MVVDWRNQKQRKHIRLGLFSTGLLFMVLSVTAPFTVSIAYAGTSSSSPLPTEVAASEWGLSPEGSAPFVTPYAITSAPNGDVYVLNSLPGDGNIQRFSSSGTLKDVFGDGDLNYGDSSNGFGALAADSHSNIYGVNYTDQSIEKFSSDGTLIAEWDNGLTYASSAVAVDASDNVYTIFNGTVSKFTSSGIFITQWTIPTGTGPGEIGGIVTSLAVDGSGNVYVSAVGNGSRIQKFTNTGTYLTTIGTTGTGDGQFIASPYPIALTLDATGNIYAVAFNDNSRVQKFDSDGNFIAKWNLLDGSLPLAITSVNDALYISTINGMSMPIIAEVKKFTFPQNLANLTVAFSQKIDVALPEGCNITNHAVLAPTASDKNYNYPLGLTSFTFSTSGCTAGMTIPVSVTFQTDLKPTDVVARKYNANTQIYETIPGAIITETTINGNHALRLDYSVTDGGPLDEDGIANGIIVDPVGLGTLASVPSIGAPNTGVGPVSTSFGALIYPALAVFGLAGLAAAIRRHMTISRR